MRPVTRGSSPQPEPFEDYHDARPFLISRIGPYCSYCERRAIPLHVEHVQPQSRYAELVGEWTNFLLACVNCNSTKLNKDVDPALFYLPDRDNTLAAFEYRADGTVHPSDRGDVVAERSLRLVGLEKPVRHTLDENGQLVAMDRVADRMTVWGMARESCSDLASCPTREMHSQVVRTALATGFFSVWMTVFADNPMVRRLLVEAFRGTAPDCFTQGAELATPRPANELNSSGKI